MVILGASRCAPTQSPIGACRGAKPLCVLLHNPPKIGGKGVDKTHAPSASLAESAQSPLIKDEQGLVRGLVSRCYNGGEDDEKPSQASPESAR